MGGTGAHRSMSRSALGTGRCLEGRILVTDRCGRLRVIQGWKLREERLAELEVSWVSEVGLM